MVPEERVPLGPDDPTMYLGDAARLLGVTPAAVRKAVAAHRPSIRGLAPYSEHNPTGKWAVSVADVEAEARRRGRARVEETPSVDAMRVEMLQAALSEEKDKRIAQLEDMLATVRAEKDARITQLELQVELLGRSLAAMTVRNP
jgi:predicted transcriptional regulator